jgi:hypothetical protein
VIQFDFHLSSMPQTPHLTAWWRSGIFRQAEQASSPLQNEPSGRPTWPRLSINV